MKRLAWMLLMMIGLTPARSDAARPLTRPQVLLWEASTTAELRGQLRAFADSAMRGDAQARLDAGEALYFLAQSYDRDAQPDSAIDVYRRAVASRGDRAERLGLVDLLLARRGPEAAAEVRRLLADDLQQVGTESAWSAANLYARLAWVQSVAAQPESAATWITEWTGPLTRDAAWAKRLADIAAQANRPDLVWRLALPIAVRSHGLDPQAMRLLSGAAHAGATTMDAAAVVARESARRDSVSVHWRRAVGARSLTVRAADGFPLAVTFFPARAASRPRVALLIAQPSDTLALFDSLAVQLSRAGVAVAILDPRGSRGSVAASAPGPDVWTGQEARFLERTARDAKDALTALVNLRLVDARRALIGATGSLALAAAEMGCADPRVAGVLLITPAPAGVDRGRLRASLRASALPLFLQVAPEDVEATLLADRLAEWLPMKQTRVADTRQAGRSAAVFRGDAKAVGRLLTWWQDAPPRPPATPPSRRR